MFRKDWTPRPAQAAYEDLVLNQWMTNANLQSNKDGAAQIRGFLGDYQAIIKVSGREKKIRFSVGKAGFKHQIVF